MERSNSLEKALDILVDDAACLADENIGKKLKEPEEEIIFSKDHEEKMRKLFQKEKRKNRLGKLNRYSKRVAGFLLVLLVVSGISIGSVEAWRIRFLNFTLEKGKPNTDYSFSDKRKTGYVDDEVNFEYIPEGFELTDHQSARVTKCWQFSNEEQYFQVECNSLDVRSSIDTENGTAERITINGHEAVYTSNSNINAIIWSDNKYAYCVLGNIPKKEIIQIAKNIKIQKN